VNSLPTEPLLASSWSFFSAIPKVKCQQNHTLWSWKKSLKWRTWRVHRELSNAASQRYSGESWERHDWFVYDEYLVVWWVDQCKGVLYLAVQMLFVWDLARTTTIARASRMSFLSRSYGSSFRFGVGASGRWRQDRVLLLSCEMLWWCRFLANQKESLHRETMLCCRCSGLSMPPEDTEFVFKGGLGEPSPCAWAAMYTSRAICYDALQEQTGSR